MARINDTRERLIEAVSELIWTGSYGSTTVDHICEKAGVNKGSFYHYFDSKARLAVAAIDAGYEIKRKEMDGIFSPIVPALERFKKYGEVTLKFQSEICKKYGRVLGCPLFTLGSEVSTLEAELQAKIQEIFGYQIRYFESAIRDLNHEKMAEVRNVTGMAQMIQAYVEGILTQARIQNDLAPLKSLSSGILALMGIRDRMKAAA